ncbi:hypothetical protein KC340_g16545 [Hortaea werneckii]|nr:hypothetical protein KC342_g16861 [Hortaea werneckii]KAI7059355.1 hypothetical protein KC339_g17380 [Hortaea werneckii]KAI7209675.1 hypothetical protein KC365_g15586 [Hortaea werneckii]KAI7293208.1 hypothetical protein KC340_g16545 [Hortaea werneckii]KAI7377361.1 hypothetical protein KC328_g14464 [Hortaea werneckii]
MSLPEPTAEQALDLFKAIEQHFPSQSLGGDRWYILAISAIAGSVHPESAQQLYLYLVSKLEFSTPPQRQVLMRRLREALVKLVSVVGVPKPLEAVFSMAEVEREEDRDYSFSRENWHSGPENQQRGRDWLGQIYRHNDNQTAEMMAAHKDFRMSYPLLLSIPFIKRFTGESWLSIEITYGLYLSDHTILDGIDTELVVLSGIMIQNLKRETGWHLRGTRRIGVSFEDVELIQQCIEKVAAFCGLRLTKVPRVADIEHEVDEQA